ncbi:hypothetical protein EGW08_019959 [Elysia chlorotica]|uniref:Ig-like domain-containing protein n=1 Tax=Elysia chlorotica TaxID=188477 RepID=A0A433SSP8_ELYCH|nr:hypothetical protein EGW08_019959 [Elysia chlorotica]
MDVHKRSSQWLKYGQAYNMPITFMWNTSEANQGYSCSGKSGDGQIDTGSVMDPKFAFFDTTTVMLTPTILTACDSDSSSQVVCKVPKASVNPAPKFSFYGNGKLLQESLPAVETDSHYHQVLDITGHSQGGTTEISCQVTNTVFSDMQQKTSKSILLRLITVEGQSFQGVSSINVATLSQNFTGTLTCLVSGGFPEATIGSLACGDNLGYSEGASATVRFQNAEVTRVMHNVFCVCKGIHESGCYDIDNDETRVKLKVLCE